MVEEESNQKSEEATKDYTELVFECTICKRVYKKPGMCQACNAILKPKGE